MPYQAPVKETMFVIRGLGGLDQVRQLTGFEEATGDTVQAVLEEAAKFNADVLAPLNWTGDQQPASVVDGVVTTTPGPVPYPHLPLPTNREVSSSVVAGVLHKIQSIF